MLLTGHVAPTEQEIRTFRRDGVVVLRGVLAGHEVDALRGAVAEVVARPGPLAVQVSDGGDDGDFFLEDFRRWQDLPSLEAVARESALPAVAAALTGSPMVRLFHDHVLVRGGGTPKRTPWHQDQPYYDIDGSQTVSFWLPLDSVPVDESLQVVAGTHLGPWLMPRTFRDGAARWFPEGSLAELPDIDADPAAFDLRSFSVQPGDAVCFDFLSVHGAPGTSDDRPRRIVSLRYVGDDVVRAARPWRTSPPFPELVGVLADGEPLDHPAFPVVWPGDRLPSSTHRPECGR